MISDRQLFFIVAVIVAVDVVVLTTWEILDPMRVDTFDLNPEVTVILQGLIFFFWNKVYGVFSSSMGGFMELSI